jgi:hypothetical protein
MLNASHSSIAYLMALADVVYVDEAVTFPTSDAISTGSSPKRRFRHSPQSPATRRPNTPRPCCDGSPTPVSETRSRASASTARRSFRSFLSRP